MSRCNCCQTDDPCGGFPTAGVTLHQWRGTSQTIVNDLRTYPAWAANDLDRFKDAVLMWKVILWGSGDVAAGTDLCLGQNRRSGKVWVTPADITQPLVGPHDEHSWFNVFEPLQVGTMWKHFLRNGYGDAAKRSVRRVPYPYLDYPLPPDRNTGQPHPNNFTLSWTHNGLSATTDSLPWNATAAQIQGKLETMLTPPPLSFPLIGSGNVSVSGGPMPVPNNSLVIEFTGAFAGQDVAQLTVSGMDGSYGIRTLQNGGFGLNDRQVLRMLPVRCGEACVESSGVQLAQATWQNSGTILVESDLPFEFALVVQCLGCYYSAEFNLWGQYERQSIGWHYCPNEDPVHTGAQPFISTSQFGPDGFDAHIRNESFTADNATGPRDPVCAPEVVYFGDGSFTEALNPRCILNPSNQCDYPHTRLNYRPTADLDRLRWIYGTAFSYWGGWIKRPLTNPLQTTFDQYDFSRATVIWLGGLSLGGIAAYGGWGGAGDEYAIQFPFAVGALDPLIAWLDAGEHVLVLDGGMFPEQFYSALGLGSTVEPDGYYSSGTITAPSLNFRTHASPTRPAPPTWRDVVCSPSGSHPWLTDVDLVDVPTNSAPNELVRVTRKWPRDLFAPPGPGFYDVEVYTTSIPVVSPSGEATILGRVIGDLPNPNPGYSNPFPPVLPVDYPGVVVESSKATFQMTFTHAGSTETTSLLPSAATAAQVKSALEGLSNIGSGLNITGGPLPAEIRIEFTSAATQQQDVNQLAVDNGLLRVDTDREGVAGTINELQVLRQRKVPSRIVISQVNELVDPRGWGNAPISTPPLSEAWEEYAFGFGRGGLSSNGHANFLSNLFTSRLEF